MWSEARQKVILWWTATPGACCDAYWGVAESSDGIHFDLISLNETGADHLHASALSQQQQPPPQQQQQQQQPARRRRPRLQSSMLGNTAGVVNPKDGNAVLIDDDGVGYIAYTAMAPFGKLPNGTLKPGPAGPHGHPAGFKGDHMVAIERLTPVRKMPFSGRDVPSENLEFAKTGSGETHEERSVCVFLIAGPASKHEGPDRAALPRRFCGGRDDLQAEGDLLHHLQQLLLRLPLR